MYSNILQLKTLISLWRWLRQSYVTCHCEHAKTQESSLFVFKMQCLILVCMHDFYSMMPSQTWISELLSEDALVPHKHQSLWHAGGFYSWSTGLFLWSMFLKWWLITESIIEPHMKTVSFKNNRSEITVIPAYCCLCVYLGGPVLHGLVIIY